MADPSPAIDFSGLSNRSRGGVSYSEVLAPDTAEKRPGTGYEAAEFQLQKPAWRLGSWVPRSVEPLLTGVPK